MNAADINIGDLVTIKPTTAPPALYGTGLVIDRIELCSENKNAVRVKVLWSGSPTAADNSRIGDCHPNNLELVK